MPIPLKLEFKGTVGIILRCPPCEDANARFTTVPYKSFLINTVEDIVVLHDLKYKCNSYLISLNLNEKKQQLNIFSFENYKH